jgi:hypothetical protein
MKCRSPNQEFHLEVSKGIIDKTGDSEVRVGNGVTLRRDDVLQFEKNLRAPTIGAVANDGTTVVIEGKNWEKSSEERVGDEQYTTIYTYEQTGKQLWKKNLDTREISACAIDAAGDHIAVVGTIEPDTHIIIYDVSTGNKTISRDYDSINIPTEISTVESYDGWLFKITDGAGGNPTSIYITTIGETVSDPDILTSQNEEETEEDEAIETLLRDHGYPVPEVVDGLAFSPSSAPDSQNAEQLRALVERGPIYEPSWGEHTFLIPEMPKVLYVLDADSVADAAAAFNQLCVTEQIDLSTWYEVESTSGTVTPSSGDFEEAIRRVTRTASTDNADVGGAEVSITEDDLYKNLIRKDFFENPEELDQKPNIGAPNSAFPDSDFGDLLLDMVRGEYKGDYEQLVAEVEPEQIIKSFPTLLDLLATGEVFEPYSIDLKYNRPFVQPVFNEVARESPEAVLASKDKLKSFLQDSTSITAPEVSYRVLKTLIEVHPTYIDEIIPLLQDLLQNRSAHPKRRALDILTAAVKNGNIDIEAVLDVESGKCVEYLLDGMKATESAWLRYAYCAVLLESELEEQDYDLLVARVETLIETFRFGRTNDTVSDHSGQNTAQIRGLSSPVHGVSTDQELLEKIRSPSPSSTALYRLHKYGAGKLLEKLATERPESILTHLDILMEDFPREGHQEEEVHKVAKRIIRNAIRNLPERQYNDLEQYDSDVLPLLHSDNRHDARFALEWARRSASKAVIEVLCDIHNNPTHNRWQQSTTILEDIAPERVVDSREPDNARTEWIRYVSNVAAEQGRLPASGDMRDRSDTPGPPFWEVFEGWQSVLGALDIDTTYRTSNAPLRSRLIEDLQRVARLVDDVPKVADIKEYSDYTYRNYKNEFGGIRQARKVAGLTEDRQ